jgi:hypothetical protein
MRDGCPVTDSASIVLATSVVVSATALCWWELRRKASTPRLQHPLLDAVRKAERLRKTNPAAADQLLKQADAEYASHDQEERLRLQDQARFDPKARAALVDRLRTDLQAIARVQQHLQANRSTIPRVEEGLQYYADRARTVRDQIAALAASASPSEGNEQRVVGVDTPVILGFPRFLVGIGLAGLMAYAVDIGITHAWSTWQQGTWFLAMVALGSFGMGPLLRLFGQDERLAWLPLLICFLLALVYPIAWQLQLRLGTPYLSTYLVAVAFTFAFGAWRRAWWLWNLPRKWLTALGDRVAQVVYFALAILFVVLAIAYAGK